MRPLERPTPRRSRRPLVRAAASIATKVLLLVAAQPAIAQETRAETIRDQQAARQSLLTPPESSRLEISATGGVESWAQPAHAYFRRERDRWALVGFERVPGGNSPGAIRVESR